MKIFKFWIKISWLVSFCLGIFWVGCGIFAMVNNYDDLTGKSYLMALVWFALAYVLKKINGQNKSYKKYHKPVLTFLVKLKIKTS